MRHQRYFRLLMSHLASIESMEDRSHSISSFPGQSVQINVKSNVHRSPSPIPSSTRHPGSTDGRVEPRKHGRGMHIQEGGLLFLGCVEAIWRLSSSIWQRICQVYTHWPSISRQIRKVRTSAWSKPLDKHDSYITSIFKRCCQPLYFPIAGIFLPVIFVSVWKT